MSFVGHGRANATRSVVQSALRTILANASREVTRFEMLEGRVLLCATAAELIDVGVPEDMIHDGHIYRSDFEKLPVEMQAHFDPHWVQDDPGHVDFDRLLGLPLFNSQAEAQAARMVDALPDFFPQLPSGDGISTTTTFQPGRTLIRFGTQVNNQGTGPGSLISNETGGPIPTGAPITSWINENGGQNVLQPVYTYTGSSFVLSYYRLAGTMTYHAGHGHLHYNGYANYALRHRNGDGTPGAYVERPDGTGHIGAKVGFCLLTFSGTFITEGGQSSSSLPGFGQDTNAPGSCGYSQGIRVGRYDIYSSSLEGQWLDVTGVTNGQYFLEITLDGENAMLETNEANNAKNFPFTLNANPPAGTPITPDQYDLGALQNDTFETAVDFGELGVFIKTGLNIDWGYDFDYFKFTATSAGAGTISTTSAQGDINLHLYDSGRNLIKQATTTAGNETINWNFVKGAEYYVMVRTYNSTTSSNYQINWNIKPTVVFPVIDNVAVEMNGDTGMFQIKRNGPTTGPLSVPFTLGGTAIRDVDYTLSSPDASFINPTTISIGNLAQAVHIIVIPISDGIVEGPETVTLTVNTNAAYVVEGTTATVTIYDKPVSNIKPPAKNTGFPPITRGGVAPGLFSDSKSIMDMDPEAVDLVALV